MQIGNTQVPVTIISPTELTATVSASLLSQGNLLGLVVTNSTGSSSGGGNGSVTLEVDNAVPILTAATPNALPLGAGSVTLTLTGTGFVPTTTMQINGSPRATTFVSPTQITTSINPVDTATPAPLAITANNPTPGGGVSGTLSLPVLNPVPGNISLSPATVSVGAPAGNTITVNGTNLVQGASARVNGSARPTSVVSGTQLSFQLTAADQATAGSLLIDVSNPAPGGGTSMAVNLAVTNPAPGSLTLSPSSVPSRGTTAVTVTVSGANFVSSSIVQVNGTSRPTAYGGATQLTFQLAPADQATPAALSISVITPGPGGGTSPAIPLSVVQTPPVLSSITPSNVNVGSGDLLVTAAGNNFTPTCFAVLNGQALPSTVASAQVLQFTVPGSAMVAVGSLALSVRDTASGVASSNSVSLAVINPVPAVAQSAPYAITVNSPDTTIDFIGSNFNENTVVLLGGVPLATTFINTTHLSAVVPATDLTTAGQLSLMVVNPAPQGGSVTVGLTVAPAPPVLTSLTPSSVLVGSGSTSITVTGQGFTPYSTVLAGSFYGATTYISPTTLTFTTPSYYAGSTGTYFVSVREPSAAGKLSNSLPFQVVNPVPVLTGISPAVVTAGAPNFNLTLTGSGFLSSSQVSINGVSHPINTGDTTSLIVTVNAAEVSNIGTLTVVVTNAGPGGGTSNPEILQAVSANNRIRTIGVSATALGWDAAHSLLLAATSSTSALNPNSLIAIDPLQGTVLKAQSLPAQPDGLSVTDDDSYVYVSLPSTGQVQRLILPSLQPDIIFSIGDQAPGYPWRAEQLLAAPGHPHTVAVNRHDQGSVLGARGGIVVYDDGVARPNAAVPMGFDANYDALVWGADDSTLYATNDYISTGEENVFSVNAQGVTLASSTLGVLSTFIQHMAFDPATSRLIDDFGGVSDALTKASSGQLAGVSPISSVAALNVTLDTAQRRAFYVGNQSLITYGSDFTIRAYDIDRYQYLNELTVPGLSSFTAITRWGTSGLAVSSTSQIFLIDGSFVSLAGISSSVGSYVAPSPTLLSLTPAAVQAGSPDMQLTLTGKDFSLASTVTWNDQTLRLDSVTDTQLKVTIPAAMLATPVAAPLIVTNGPGTLAAPSMGFSVLPDLGPTAQLSLLGISGSDIAWDSTRSLLYVSVPYTDPAYPNSIAVVDPTAGTLVKTVPVLNQPGAISITDDNALLYAAFHTSPVVQRFALPDFSLDLTIPLSSPAIQGNTPVGGRETCTFGVDVKAAPGQPHTVAIDQGNYGREPLGCGALTIYDDAVQRPNALSSTNGGDQSSITWGLDANTLFGQSDVEIQTQALSELSVSPSGVFFQKGLGSGSFGPRTHFDSLTGYLFSDYGVVTNPANATKVGNLVPDSNAGYPVLALPDSANNRVYLLLRASGGNSHSYNYALQIFDLAHLTLMNTITLPNILGLPSRLIRWGANGLAIPTNASDGVGGLYLLQGTAFTSH